MYSYPTTILTTPPTAEPITLDEAKLHAKIDINTDDSTTTRMISASRRWVETYTGRQIMQATWTAYWDTFPPSCPSRPWNAAIYLPYPPIIQINSLKYYDTTNTQQTLTAGTDYGIDTSEPSRIVHLFGAIWPQTYAKLGAVSAEYVAGYGNDASDVPENVKQAILILVNQMDRYREKTVSGLVLSEVKFSVESLLSGERMMEMA